MFWKVRVVMEISLVVNILLLGVGIVLIGLLAYAGIVHITRKAARVPAQVVGDSLETIAQGIRRGAAEILGLGKEIVDKSHKTLMVFTFHAEKTKAIHEWAMTSKKIKVSYAYTDRIGWKYCGISTEIVISQEFEIKAGINLSTIAVEIPEEGSDSTNIIYHLPPPEILSYTPVEGTFEVNTGLGVWNSIKDTCYRNAQEALLLQVKEAAIHSDLILAAEKEAAKRMLQLHESQHSLSSYIPVIKSDFCHNFLLETPSEWSPSQED